MPVTADLYFHLYEGSEEGQNPPVILIHGAGGTHLFWPSEVRRLPGYRVYAIDLPGHGKSGGRGQQSIQAYAEVILDWLGAIGVHRGVIVGHSMGVAIALSLALNYPERVVGLGLVGGGARLRVSPALLESAASPTTFHNAIEFVVAHSFSPTAPPRLAELAGQRMRETRASVLHSDFLACDAFDETERISQIRHPTLVVCGADDRMTPARYSQALADQIPNARLKLIPQAGHMVMLEKPQIVAETLAGFLPSVPY
jgi:pimeloyl-ACP methyl ester carboxylesterase